MELLVVMVIIGVSVATVVLAMPSTAEKRVENEEMRLQWVVQEMHIHAQRYRRPLVLQRLERANGYFVGNLPHSLTKEDWAQIHECDCTLTRLDKPLTQLTVFPDAVLPPFEWRISAGERHRIVKYPEIDHAQ